MQVIQLTHAMHAYFTCGIYLVLSLIILDIEYW